MGPVVRPVADLHLNPYAGVDWDDVERHKAQLHAHTWHPPNGSHSGSDPPEVVVDDYREAGYSVLALTDHEYNIEEPTWPWTDFERDPAALGMVAVPSVELTVEFGGGGDDTEHDGEEGTERGSDDESTEHDLLSYFCDLSETNGSSVHDVLEAIGDRDGLAVFPHPSRYNDDGSWYVEYFRAHPHLLGVEVVNAADRYPTDRDVWDDLQGRLGTERPAWGFSNDDYHGRDREYPFDRSRNVLVLAELTERAVREALTRGRFFYQHVVGGDPHRVEDEPPAIGAIRHDPDRGRLAVEARNYDALQWASEGAVVDRGPTLRYREVDDLGSFVRARLVTEGGSETGTQPFLLA